MDSYSWRNNNSLIYEPPKNYDERKITRYRNGKLWHALQGFGEEPEPFRSSDKFSIVEDTESRNSNNKAVVPIKKPKTKRKNGKIGRETGPLKADNQKPDPTKKGIQTGPPQKTSLKDFGKAVFRLFYTKKPPTEKLPEDELIEVPAESSSHRKSLEDEEYYHGYMRDEEVEKILSERDIKEGQFLVRRVQTYTGLEYVLSVKRDWKVHNLLINRTEHRKLYWLDAHAFQTIQQLVKFYMKSRMIFRVYDPELREKDDENRKQLNMADIKGIKGRYRLDFRLTTPIPRFRWQINHEQIELTTMLGSGQFGEVHKGYLEVSFSAGRYPVAVKTLKGETLTTQEIYDMLREADNMKELEHRNVVKFYGIAASKEPIMIALEFCPGGALDVRLERSKTTDFQKIRFLYHAALGITYLHDQDIVHGDIAARNCLLDANDVLKISDFGLSTDNEGSRMKGDKVPIRYMAPEAIEKKISIKANDSWAFSVLIFEVFHRGFGPYHEYDPEDRVVDLLKKDELHMYLFERPNDEILPPGITANIRKWSLSLDKPDRPQIQAQMEILFKQMRFRNVKYRLAFDPVFKARVYISEENPKDILEKMMTKYGIED
ncbi:hypothetical protein B9Z55_020747 [Caenorhabditis nigoni]|uniref:Tyrosine-protein kinase n=1 Tax=Caenorhabditis nigoni TaxID=1611254 RepID=A0A2G5TNY1_9PELO|nr:hypothetical protein B9Z55_020747 [Caenorhabditis nigoni]